MTASLTRYPLEGYREKCDTSTVLGTRYASKPLEIAIPVTIAGMSFGALSATAKVALGRAASAVGTSTTTGDGGMIPEERAASRLLVYQCLPSRYGFNPDDLRQADAIEIVIGQGAKPGGGGLLLGQKVTDRVAGMRTLPPGVDQRSASRHPDWVARRGPLVDARRQGAHRGHPLGDLLPEQHAAAARLGALADDDLDRVGPPQVVGVEPVPRRQALVHQQAGGGSFLVGHAAVAGGRRRAHRGGRLAERGLGGRRQGAEAHAGDRDGDVELNGLAGEPGAEHRLHVALLPVPLERVPGQRGGEEHQVVEGGHVPLGAPAADLVVAVGRGPLDLRDDLGREEAAAPVGIHRQAGRGGLIHQYFWSFSASKL